MTKDEAKEILKRQHYCLKHFRRMEVDKPNPFANLGTGLSYYCGVCELERKEAERAEVNEALTVLGAKP